jgi:V8-like Glu-specific endopeptidase
MTKRPIGHPILKVKAKGDTPARPNPKTVKSYGVIPFDELEAIAKEKGMQRRKAFKPAAIHHAKTPKVTKPDALLEPGLLLPKDGLTGSGVDRAVVSDPSSYPYCCIGKIFVGWNNNFDSVMWTGSAALVGPNLLLTASHVAPWGQNGAWLRFVPSYDNGSEPFGSSYVEHWYGIQNSDTVEGHDYVICSLYTPLGYQCGWMGSYYWGDAADYENKTWSSVGYPANLYDAQEEIVETGVTITNVVFDSDGGAELMTNNDFYTSPGWSGGPLFGYLPGDEYPAVVGVMSGWESFNTGELDDVNAGGKYLVDLVIYGEQTWPAPPQ